MPGTWNKIVLKTSKLREKLSIVLYKVVLLGKIRIFPLSSKAIA